MTSFRPPFLWGAATSSHQIEGDNVHNDWWQWELQGNVDNGERSGKATDHWNRFREDLRLAEELGLTSYRFSIEWSRLEPEEGRWDKDALEWYRELIAECEKRSLVPMATLLHFTIPRWLADKGGFTWEHAPDKFAGFVRHVARELGSRVPLWCTLNEPNSMVVGQYLGAFMPPAQYDPGRASLCCRNLLRAHVKAYDILHAGEAGRSGPWASWPRQVGIAHNMADFRPLHPANPIERLMAGVFRRFYNRSWPDALTGRKQHFGVLGLVPYAKPVWEARGRKTVDYLGINYYTRIYVCWGPQDQEASFVQSKRMPVGVVFAKPGEARSDLGWAVSPGGLGRMIRFLKRYEVPLYVTENGIADDKDRLRPSFLVEHLKEVAGAAEKGADIRGYYHWSLLDNFEWSKGFGPRFGLCEVDYSSFRRTPRPSYYLYQSIVKAHREAGASGPLTRLLAQTRAAAPSLEPRAARLGEIVPAVE
jgi:beta-glucosidase